LDIENFGNYMVDKEKTSCNKNCDACPRSKSRNAGKVALFDKEGVAHYDVVVIGAGCIGASIARELSRYKLSVLMVEAADDVTQGATKGNSGIVHAGYDDKPGSNRAKFCWPGNQMFAQLDKELRFGYQKNGSLVVAFSEEERKALKTLYDKGQKNGVKNLRIIERDELFELEPAIKSDAVAALLAPDAGNVIPYEYAIALAENAVDNGVELRIRREVVGIQKLQEPQADDKFHYELDLRHWEPRDYIEATTSHMSRVVYLSVNIVISSLIYVFLGQKMALTSLVIMIGANVVLGGPLITGGGGKKEFDAKQSFETTVKKAKKPAGGGRVKSNGKASQGSATQGSATRCSVKDMMTGGSGSWNAVRGETVDKEKVRARFVVNAAGGASSDIANMIGDDSFKIKPRLGDYMLLNRNQGHLTKHTLFPCPDPVLGKGVLVQTTLWGNLILGPTARDYHRKELMAAPMKDIQEYIFSKCKKLVPYFDSAETIHSFCGARSKSDRGDWIIENSVADKTGHFVHCAGIDSPGLAGSPALAVEIVRMLKANGLRLTKDPNFNPNRAPIIRPKNGMKGLKMGPPGKVRDPKQNVICKCEKVTEEEVVEAMSRSLPIDSTQAIRKRTRAGMGHCQAEGENYNCECRVAAIIARENKVDVSEVGGRPFPATSSLKSRWITGEEKNELRKLQHADTKLVM